MSYNKIIQNGTALLDLTQDSVTPAVLGEGYTAHDATGASIVGTATGGNPISLSTQAEMDAVLTNATSADVGKLYLYTGTTTTTGNIYENNTLYKVVGGGYSVTLENISSSRSAISYSVDGGTSQTLAVGSSVLITPETSLRIIAGTAGGNGFITTDGTTPSDINYQYRGGDTITDFSGITIIKAFTGTGGVSGN